MGKRSIKENKNIYQTSREDLALTREKASQLMQFMSADRIEKIENAKELLTQTDNTIQVISQKCGFHTSQYFSSSFRRKKIFEN